VLLVVHRIAGADTIGLWTRGGKRRILPQAPGWSCGYPAYSRSGHVLFQRSAQAHGIWAFAFSLDRLERRGEPFLVAGSGYMPSVSDDGTLVCGTLRPGVFGTHQLVWLDRTGATIGTVGPVLPALVFPTLSPDGSRVLTIAGDAPNTEDLWVIPAQGEGAFPMTEHNRGPYLNPFWRKDGQSVFYTRIHQGSYSIMSQPADGTGEEQAVGDGLGTVSPSGKYLLRIQRPAGSRYLSRWSYVELPGTNATPLKLSEMFEGEMAPSFSGDDRWLAFSSSLSGREEIWVVDFPGLTNRMMVSRQGGRVPRWSSNGQELFYLTLDGKAMISARLKSEAGRFEEPTKVFDVPANLYRGSAIGSLRQTYDIAADGQRFLMLQNAGTGADEFAHAGMLLFENWAEAFPNQRATP
jgi:eukaryotic-like serine/threonine-protein kinase